MGIAEERAELAQLADDRTPITMLNELRDFVERTRARSVALLGETHGSIQTVTGAAAGADARLTEAHTAVERFLQEILNAIGGS